MGNVQVKKQISPISFGVKMKVIYLVLLSTVLFNLYIPKAGACTTFLLRNGEHIVVGRNFDLSYGKYLIFANRRNVTKVALQYPSESISSPAIWTSKYGSITFNMVGSDIPTDGMNEAGLVISTLILDYSVYPAGDQPSILAEQWLHYMLDNFSTVDEVIAASSSLKMRINPFINWELHYFVTDKSGACAAIEFIEGEAVVTTGAALEKKVLANSTYESSLQYFYNGREQGRPMTASWNRFYTAVEMTDAYTNEDLVDYSYSIMDSAEQSFTQRKIVYDITNMRIYLKSLENEQLRYFDMNSFDFSGQEQTIIYKETLADVGNIRGLFVPYTNEINRTAIESGWNYMGVAYTVQELIDYSEIPGTYESVFAQVGDDAIICIDSYEITGNTTTYYTGKWSLISGAGVFDNSSVANTFIRELGYGENTIRWTLEGNSRTFHDDIVITNNQVIAVAGYDVVVCENEFTLTGNIPKANEQGNWEIISGSGIFRTSSVYNTLISELSNGISELQWNVKNSDCESSDFLEITNNSVNAFAGNDTEICGTETTLSANNPSPNVGNWKVIKGSGQIENTNTNTSKVEQLELGENHFEWTVIEPGGCTATDQVIISNNLIIANAGEDQTVESNSAYLSANKPVSGIGVWSIAEGEAIFSNGNNHGTLAYDLGVGLNKFIWEIRNNSCSDKDTVNITYDINNSVLSPENEFSFNISPNPAGQFINIEHFNSGKNEYKLSIYNIKGQTVYAQNHNSEIGLIKRQINIGNLPKGQYVLSIITGSGKKQLKFMKL